jgi:serine/threonine protein kinase
MNMQVVVIGGPDQGQVFLLAEGQTLRIGRGQASNTQLGDPRVSRMHCHLELDGGTAMLSDSGGSGGTLVNGKPISRQELQPGDVIRIGDTELRFQLEGVPEQAMPIRPGLSKPKPRPEVTPVKDLVGQSLSHFQLEEVIAKGTTGLVFRARDTEHDRPAALKVLEPQFAGNEENMQRFVRAMKTMLPIHHENIVSIYAAGKSGPYCWVAMEYVDGENLEDVIDRISREGLINMEGQLDWRDAFRVGVHIARALQAAYEHQIIHRNITPRNILLRRHDKSAKLGDLMLAKALEGSLAREITRPGQLIGEVAYMSPERTQSQVHVDCRSDIYGLGATVYALLTAHPPFEGDSLPAVLKRIREEEPAEPRQYQLGVPDQLEAAVLRMLAKRPGDRYQTPRALLSDLMRIANYEGVEV